MLTARLEQCQKTPPVWPFVTKPSFGLAGFLRTQRNLARTVVD